MYRHQQKKKKIQDVSGRNQIILWQTSIATNPMFMVHSGSLQSNQHSSAILLISMCTHADMIKSLLTTYFYHIQLLCCRFFYCSEPKAPGILIQPAKISKEITPFTKLFQKQICYAYYVHPTMRYSPSCHWQCYQLSSMLLPLMQTASWICDYVTVSETKKKTSLHQSALSPR